ETGLQLGNLYIQLLHLVEQQGIEQLILYRLDGAIRIARHQVRKNLGDFLRYQSILDWLGAIAKRLLIAESNGAEAHKILAGRAHVLDIFLESPRRTDGA